MIGLANLNVVAYLTPERRGGLTKNEKDFWNPLFELYPKDRYVCTLIDDNLLNCKLVKQLGKLLYVVFFLVLYCIESFYFLLCFLFLVLLCSYVSVYQFHVHIHI